MCSLTVLHEGLYMGSPLPPCRSAAHKDVRGMESCQGDLPAWAAWWSELMSLLLEGFGPVSCVATATAAASCSFV